MAYFGVVSTSVSKRTLSSFDLMLLSDRCSNIPLECFCTLRVSVVFVHDYLIYSLFIVLMGGVRLSDSCSFQLNAASLHTVLDSGCDSRWMYCSMTNVLC